METVSPDSFRRDVRVIGLIGVAHAFSHFFQLALPPLFPLLRVEFDVSWALLGLLVGVFYGASGITQFVAGFAVDRFGARPVLLGGLGLLAGGTMVAALAPGAYWLFPIVALMGVGNGVFHPCDFAILNANVAPQRLGYAYSTHGVGGNIGFALAPIVSYALAAAFNWRIALACMGIAGLIALGVLASQRTYLTSHPAHDAHTHTLGGSMAINSKGAQKGPFCAGVAVKSSLNELSQLAELLTSGPVTITLRSSGSPDGTPVQQEIVVDDFSGSDGLDEEEALYGD